LDDAEISLVDNARPPTVRPGQKTDGQEDPVVLVDLLAWRLLAVVDGVVGEAALQSELRLRQLHRRRRFQDLTFEQICLGDVVPARL
jgi:hypothetical protein